MFTAALFTIAKAWKQCKCSSTEEWREFPGGPVVKTQRFQCHAPGSIPGVGTKIQQAAQRSQKKE